MVPLKFLTDSLFNRILYLKLTKSQIIIDLDFEVNL